MWLGFGREETQVCGRFANPLAFFLRLKLARRRELGECFSLGLSACTGVRTQKFSERESVSVSDSRTESRPESLC